MGVDEAGEQDVGGVIFVEGSGWEGGRGEDTADVDRGYFAGEGGDGDGSGCELVADDGAGRG